MRVVILCFFLAVTCVSAQRPWIRQSTVSPGPLGKMSVSYNRLYYYDTVALSSFDHGATWTEITGLRGRVCTIDEYTQDVTVAVCYDSATATATGFFTTSGLLWTEFRSISGSARPVRLAVVGDVWYLGTDGPVIYRGSETLDSLRLPGNARVIDLVAAGDVLVASTTTGIHYTSTSGPVSWTTIAQDGLGVLFVRDGTVYAAGVKGVKRLDLGAKRAVDMGSWNVNTPAPAVLDLDTYQGALLAITRDASSYQAYRLEGDTAWKAVAYPLPGTMATVTRSILSVDAGWMVLSHQITEGFVDSAGVYAFDLNDFTSVNDLAPSDRATMSVTDNGTELLLTRSIAVPARVIITDLHGRTLHEGRLDGTRTTDVVRIPHVGRGFMGITVVTDAGSVARTVIVR